MAETQVCDTCKMEFDWPGVSVAGYEYCCKACSVGEACTCPQHHHAEAPMTMNRAAAGQVGTIEE